MFGRVIPGSTFWADPTERRNLTVIQICRWRRRFRYTDPTAAGSDACDSGKRPLLEIPFVVCFPLQCLRLWAWKRANSDAVHIFWGFQSKRMYRILSSFLENVATLHFVRSHKRLVGGMKLLDYWSWFISCKEFKPFDNVYSRVFARSNSIQSSGKMH